MWAGVRSGFSAKRCARSVMDSPKSKHPSANATTGVSQKAVSLCSRKLLPSNLRQPRASPERWRKIFVKSHVSIETCNVRSESAIWSSAGRELFARRTATFLWDFDKGQCSTHGFKSAGLHPKSGFFPPHKLCSQLLVLGKSVWKPNLGLVYVKHVIL